MKRGRLLIILCRKRRGRKEEEREEEGKRRTKRVVQSRDKMCDDDELVSLCGLTGAPGSYRMGAHNDIAWQGHCS